MSRDKSREEFAGKFGKMLQERHIKRRYIPKYMKPKIIESASQFPFRCPICWNKFFHKNQAEDCLDRCWEIIPDMIWSHIGEPKEIDNWQWDLDKTQSNIHPKGRSYCGVVYYDNGDIKFFKFVDGNVIFIGIEELELGRSKGFRLYQ